VATFASVIHVAEPPGPLKDRVMAVLSDEWSEAQSQDRGPRRWLGVRLPALAAALVLLAGLITGGTASQVHAWRLSEDAASYHRFLDALGGRDVRVGQIQPIGGGTLEGSVILYDSDRGQSWVLVFAKAQGLGDVQVKVQGPQGQSLDVPFPLKFEDDGEGWTGMVTSGDLSRFDRAVFVTADGTVIATARIQTA
jgi:hypothetical protein